MCFVGQFLGRALKTNLDYTLNITPYSVGDVARNPDSPVRVLAWSEPMLEYLGAMYFLGYLSTQLLAGYLSSKVPSHLLLGRDGRHAGLDLLGAQVRRHVRNTAVRVVQATKPLGFDMAVGSSGTIINLAEIAGKILCILSKRSLGC